MTLRPCDYTNYQQMIFRVSLMILSCCVKGLFESYHMHYEMDRDDPNYNHWAEPSRENMTVKALEILQKHNDGYFLMVEGTYLCLYCECSYRKIQYKQLIPSIVRMSAK